MKRAPSKAPGSVRIVAGRLRGSKLPVPEAPGLRPTSDRVRETLFNWLMPVIEGSRCLDLFAGTGALGIEAASRGAREVVLVEHDARLARALEAQLERLRVPEARVVSGAAEGFLRGAATPFDIVFIDPPFARDLWGLVAEALEQGGWLRANAMIYVESPRDQALNLPACWQPWREGAAGEVRYALYRRAP